MRQGRQVVAVSRGTAVCSVGTVHGVDRRLAAEDSAQCVNRQEEAARGIDPPGTVESQSAGGNDVVDMGMMLKVLSPGMEHAKESYVGSQVLGIASQFEHGRGAGAVEQVVEQPLVLEDKSREFVRQGEDDVEVRNWQQF